KPGALHGVNPHTSGAENNDRVPRSNSRGVDGRSPPGGHPATYERGDFKWNISREGNHGPFRNHSIFGEGPQGAEPAQVLTIFVESEGSIEEHSRAFVKSLSARVLLTHGAGAARTAGGDV